MINNISDKSFMKTSGSYLQNLPLLLNLQMKGSFGVIFSYKNTLSMVANDNNNR